MPSTKTKSKKDKKLAKLIEDSDSGDESEHELSHYINDRVKLMKEVLKIIKPKKIKTMAPNCMKDLDLQEVNSMLLEELLGISNKRLKYIFNGQNLDEDSSSSTDPEEEKPIDIISLDDISDDDFVIEIDSPTETSKKKKKKIKEEPSDKKIKKERDKSKKKQKHVDKANNPEVSQEQNLMSVLELLELQARARAIKSQLALEAQKKAEKEAVVKQEDSDNEDAIIIESPKRDEIVITSSDSDNDSEKGNSGKESPTIEKQKPTTETESLSDKNIEPNNSAALQEKSSQIDLNDIELPVDKECETLKEGDAQSLEENSSVATAVELANSTTEVNLETSASEVVTNNKEKQNSDVNVQNVLIESVEQISNNTQNSILNDEVAVTGKASSASQVVEVESNRKASKKKTHKEKPSKKKSTKLKEANIKSTVESDEKNQFDGDAGIIINIDDDDIEEINNSD